MSDIFSKIRELKNLNRSNFYFMRRRIDKGNGKKTLGWILQPEDSSETFENKDFNLLHEQKLLLEKNNDKTISNF